MRRSFWSLAPGELRVILAVIAVVLWTLTVVVWLKAPIPCGDFVCPYTMGSLVHDPQRLYDVDAFHSAQVDLVPASASLFYPPVYPPHLALVMAPFSRLSFGVAVTIWSALMVLLYAAIIGATHRALHSEFDGATTALVAIAFPPFANVVGYGQNTVLLLGACFLAWRALVSERRFLAGAALGLLALKPQFGLPFAVIVIAGREWRMCAGALFSVGLQALAVWLIMGSQAFTGYAAVLPDIVRNADALESIPAHTHSLRTLTRLIPDVVGRPLWFAAVAAVLIAVAQVWRSSAPVHVRLGFAVLAAVLVSPHLIAYDAVLLALPVFWFGQWLDTRNITDGYWLAVALLFAGLAFSWATVIRVQPSVIVMLWIAQHIWRNADWDPAAAHV